jgi:hypothetical protein
MLKSYIIISLRNILKQKSFVVINVLGLSIAIACCVVAYLNWDFNNEFDSIHKNGKNIYRINSIGGNEGQNIKIGIVPLPLGKIISENNKQISKTVRYLFDRCDILVKDNFFSSTVSYVDEDFFNLFSFNFTQGNPDDLNEKSKVFIREDIAKKYFGDENPIGKQITQFLNKDSKEYTVAGIFKRQAENSSFNFIEIIVRYDNYFVIHKEESENDWKFWNTTFVVIWRIQYN